MSPEKLKSAVIISALSLSLMANTEVSHAVERLSVTPGGVILNGSRTYSGVVIGAYQKPYAMNFEIWKPSDLPAGWYATFDGFPVAQIAENRWVYGQMGIDGAIMPTNVLVGSVVPDRVPGLARIASVWSWGKHFNSPEFLKIRDYMCNRMGWFHDFYINTIIAWNTNRPGLWIWLGNRWKRLTPRSGEYTWQMMQRLAPWIAEQLRKNNVWYTGGEPLEAADLARQWGLIWGGRVIASSLKTYGHDGGGGDSTQTTSMRDSSGSTQSETTPQEPTNNNNQGQWDVD